MKTRSMKLAAAMFAAAVAGAATAAETQASFDPKVCKADYPKASLMNEEQGTVTMSFLVGADGTVLESKVDKSSGYKNLDKAAIKALSACKFKPGTKDGAPSQGWTRIDYAWRLD